MSTIRNFVVILGTIGLVAAGSLRVSPRSCTPEKESPSIHMSVHHDTPILWKSSRNPFELVTTNYYCKEPTGEDTVHVRAAWEFVGVAVLFFLHLYSGSNVIRLACYYIGL